MSDYSESLAAIQERADENPGQQPGDAETDRKYLLALCRRLLTDDLARAWSEGFKQGGPMHDEDHNHPDAHKINPYEATK